MESIELREETVKRLDDLRIEDESYDELVAELINIYEAEELTMFHSGDGRVAASRIFSHSPRSSRCDWSSRA